LKPFFGGAGKGVGTEDGVTGLAGPGKGVGTEDGVTGLAGPGKGVGTEDGMTGVVVVAAIVVVIVVVGGVVVDKKRTASIAASPLQLRPLFPTNATVGLLPVNLLRSTMPFFQEFPWLPFLFHTVLPFTVTDREPMVLPYM